MTLLAFPPLVQEPGVMSHYLKSQQRKIDAAVAIPGKLAAPSLKPPARRQPGGVKPRAKSRAA